MPDAVPSPRSSSSFATTQWSLVVDAGRSNGPDAADALARLCQAYWYPLYAFVRRQGYSVHDAQDLTQGFFAQLLEKKYLAKASHERGRFRSFLLTALKNFLANEWDKLRAQKRGGDRVVPLDRDEGESRYAREPADPVSADRIYERRWAITLLAGVLARLRADHVAIGKGELFDALKGCLTGEGDLVPYAELAIRLHTTEGAIKAATHRLRHRYRDLLRLAVADTVADATDVDDELRHLRAALAG